MTPRKRSRILLAVLGALSILTLGPSCGGTGTDIVSGGDSFLPNFTFTWADRADPDHTFNFNPDPSDKPTGIFTTDSSETFRGTTSLFVNGTFDHSTLRFTVSRSPTPFTGRFTNNDTISLQSPEGAITLVRVRQ
jgi:hypothetical protein